MATPYRFLALSDHPVARAVRDARRAVLGFSLPAPRVLVRPLLWLFLVIRSVYYWVYRIFVCEPLFKAYCARYGRRLRTGVYIHWVQGTGDIVIGHDVTVDGKSSFTFARRTAETPTLTIGDGTYVGHDCSFTVARRIDIGRYCLLASGVRILDSGGHPTDPQKRRAGLPPDTEEIRPVVVGDNVWIGMDAVIFPGVTVGENSVVGTRAVVTKDVPANTMVAGVPARLVAVLGARGSPDASQPAGVSGS